jgi:uncharacterized membrane protein
MVTRGRRVAIAALSGLGLADSLYMLAYEEGLIDSLVCPFFGDGCNKVGRSKHARHFGVPNAAAGVLGYAAMGGLSLTASRRRWSWPALAVAGISIAAAGASAFLTWEQAAKVKAWCFWCLSSAAINAAILPLSLSNVGLPRRRP